MRHAITLDHFIGSAWLFHLSSLRMIVISLLLMCRKHAFSRAVFNRPISTLRYVRRIRSRPQFIFVLHTKSCSRLIHQGQNLLFKRWFYYVPHRFFYSKQGKIFPVFYSSFTSYSVLLCSVFLPRETISLLPCRLFHPEASRLYYGRDRPLKNHLFSIA